MEEWAYIAVSFYIKHRIYPQTIAIFLILVYL